MAKLMVLVILVLSVVVVLVKRRHAIHSSTGRPSKKLSPGTAAKESARAIARKPSKPYSAVSIKSRLDACNPAANLRDQVMLATEAPTLPLANCDAESCECRYIYHDDRRQDDRRSPFGGGHGIIGGSTGNRRDPSDRRGS